MNVEDLQVDQRFIAYLKENGILTLYPPQTECVSKGLLNGNNLVVAIPTASGKTLIAMLAIVSKLMKEGGKAVYLAPLRALASEKYDEFKEIGEQLGLKVAIASGDFESGIEWVGSNDIIIATNEKFDSIIRHQASWLNDISIVVSDEVHLINDAHRGPVLEVVLAQIKQKLPNCQLLALSATIKNAEDIAEWLDADLVLSDWRPVSLKEGVWVNGDIFWSDCTVQEVSVPKTKDGYVSLAIEAVKQGGQCLVFAGTRASVVQTAKKISLIYSRLLSNEELQNLKKISQKILRTGEKTQLSQDLAMLVEKGVAFHHAGLHNAHRRIVEDSFRSGKIKIIAASPTLCLAPDTKIPTDLGEFTVEELYRKQVSGENFKVLSLIGGKLKFTKPIEINRNFNQTPLVAFVSEAQKSLCVTENHLVLIKRNGEKLIVPANQVNNKDLIAGIHDTVHLQLNRDFSFSWEKIISIHYIHPTLYSYDLVLPQYTDHLFVADGFIVHNSAGVNTPSRRVVIRTLMRYTDGYNQPIPVLEYKQMAGRAGRPRYDPYGEAIVIARNLSEKDEIMRRYIEADTEEIYSKFGSEPALRSHLLSFIVSGDVTDFDSALDIISITFFGYQNEGQIFFIEELLYSTLDLLKEGKLISPDEPFLPTPFGIRVNQLYLDPLSALLLKQGLMEHPEGDFSDLAYFHLIAATPDVRNFYVRDKELDDLIDLAESLTDNLLVPDRENSSWEFFLQELKTALVLQAWVNEKSENEIFEKYNVTSGDLHNLVSNAEWLLHAASEIASLFKLKNHEKQLKMLTKRVKYGISEELIPLTTLNQIGRKRARILYRLGARFPQDILKIGKNKLAQYLGKKIAESVYYEVKMGEPLELEPEPIDFVEETVEEVSADSPQSSLEDFLT